MLLFEEILKKELGFSKEEKIKIAAALVDKISYQALLKIKMIIEDDSLSDAECFDKIEEIVVVLEEIGSSGGVRHDFG